MKNNQSSLLIALGLIAVLILAHQSELRGAEMTRNEVQSFFGKYCLDCHDTATAKAELSLESLPQTLDQPVWVRVHDRLKAGEMPPPDVPQPKSQEVTDATSWLARQLTAVAKNRQKTEGRVLLRRMNRREYETTLHDLLGVAEPLQHLLPEDNLVHGFDTVSRGLETSATHLLRYQQAADLAIGAALPPHPIRNTVTRWTGAEYAKLRERYMQPNFIRVDGDAFVFHSQLDANGDQGLHAPSPSGPGRYRIRAAIRAVNSGGKPVTMLIARKSDRFQLAKLMHVIDYRDAVPDKTTIIEVEAELGYTRPGIQTVYFVGVSLPTKDAFAKLRGDQVNEPLPADFAGPGLAIDWAELEGPLGAGFGEQRMLGDVERVPRMPDGKDPPDNWKNWPPTGNEFKQYPLAARSTDPMSDADRLIRAFLPLAFRRPATEAQAAHYVKIVQDQLALDEPFDEAMRAGYKAILCSPWFLNYVERPGRLDDFALAARLARFLWNSMPDAELSAVAASGTLTRPDVLRAQTERLLKDPKAARFARSFTDQWLDLGKFLDMKPDGIYVEYDDMLAWSMPMETRRFFDDVLARDLPTSSFFDSDWTFLNSRLAKHYGIEGVEGLELRKAALAPESHRGGVITHASILKLTTNASYTSPVKRGAWILERILGTPPSPPPPNVEAVEPDIRGATTIREQLDKHKNVAVCASCHKHIDPPGFALESFDVVGGWRERYRVKQGGNGNDYVELVNYPGRKVWLAKPVQADGETTNGERFADIDDYRRIVVQDRDQLTRNLAEKLIVYATGAGIDFADRAVVEQIVRDVRDKNHGFRSLLHAVVQSRVFLHK